MPILQRKIAAGAIKYKHCKSILKEPLQQTIPQQSSGIDTAKKAMGVTSSIFGGITSLAEMLDGDDYESMLSG